MFYVNPKTLFVAVLLGLLSLVGLYLVSESFEPLQPRNIVRQRQRRAPTRNSTPTTQWTQPAVPRTPTPQSTSAPDTPTSPASGHAPSILQVCRVGWETVASTHEIDLQNDLRKRLTIVPQDCLERMRAQVQANEIKNFVGHCQLQIANKTDEYIETACVRALPRFRSFVIRSLGINNPDLASLDTSELANQLFGGMVNLNQASATEIQRNIEIANALIAKDPNYYPAYKAKLINHLVAELKYSQIQNPDTYESLYNELLSFTNEAAQAPSPEPPATAEGLQVASAETLGMDTDLVHIPFLRMTAMNDLDGLTDMAQDYIESYPDSHIGYMYLADAAWRSGDSDSAVNILRSRLGPTATREMAIETLQRFQAQNPLDRIMRMAPQN